MFKIGKILGEVLREAKPYRVSEDIVINSVDHDSRRIKPGALYVAIKGENHDGHDFLMDAKDKGAAACLVERQVTDVDIPQIVVNDSIYAYGELARYWRKINAYKVIAITGSNGKTTVKDMIYHILSPDLKVSATKSNYNNLIGLPYSILGFKTDVKTVIVEMGMNRKGEIYRLSEIADPDVALVNNIGRAHIGLLGSIEAVLEAKMELFEYMLATKKKDGTFIVNLSDPMIRSWKGRDRIKKTVTYSCFKSLDSDIRLSIPADAKKGDFEIDISGLETIRSNTKLSGEYNLCNICAALSLAFSQGLEPKVALDRLKSFKLPDMRSVLKETEGIKYFIDCYNANPESMSSAVQAVSLMDAKRRIAVVGDMLELGDFSRGMHYEAGKELALASYDALFAMGDYADDYKDGFLKNSEKKDVKTYKSGEHERLKKDLNTYIAQGDVVLIKASRGVKLELVLDMK